MRNMTRRRFLQATAGPAALSLLAGAVPFAARAATSSSGSPSGRVVIVGGGFGGATCAKYLHRFAPDLSITLIEASRQFQTCPFSNTVLAGIHDMQYITHGYDSLQRRYGLKLVHDTVTDIDATKKQLSLKSGKSIDYDSLVLSPGIDFRWDAIEGYDAAAVATIPHAWQAGAQTQTLRQQLEAMADGGVVIIAPPGNPFRCPPGPYERASLIAHYLKTHKPRSKILILDAKDKFSKQALFTQGWKQLYPGMIEWVKGSDIGNIERVDVKRRALYSGFDTEYKGDVINLIPPQRAGAIAHRAGLVNNDGWCPVDQRSFESTLHRDVYVIGDASIAGQMPKSGFAANSQGKVCAAALAARYHGVDMPEPSYVNTCYSLVAPDYGISVAAVYRMSDGEIKKVEGSGGVSPSDVDEAFRRTEARYAVGWYQSITADSFG